MMLSLHSFFSVFFTVDSIKFIYLWAGGLIAVFYVPQIIRLVKDNTGASAISVSAWLGWSILRIPALIYSVLVPQDWVMLFVTLMDITGRISILIIASYKRIRFNLKVGKTKFGVLLATDFIEKELVEKELEKTQLTKNSLLPNGKSIVLNNLILDDNDKK